MSPSADPVEMRDSVAESAPGEQADRRDGVRSRRAVVAGLAALAVLGAAGCVSARNTPLPAHVASSLVISSIRVDVSQLRAKGLGPWSDLIQQATADQLRREFAGRMGSGGAVVSVVMQGVTLESYVGGGGSDFPGDAENTNDYLEGDAFVLSRRGEVLAKYHILLALPASTAGAWYLPNIDERRIVSLSQNFARWVKRDVLG
jgi:hypothetical protein